MTEPRPIPTQDAPARHTITLGGCQPRPLARYLCGMAVLRLVAEQVDSEARAWWTPDGLNLCSTLDPDALTRFFADEYVPTPVLSPWNGGSGFHPKDNSVALDTLRGSADPRFTPLRQTAAACVEVLGLLGIEDKPDKSQKEELILTLRAELPEAALRWMDAALTLTGHGPRFPPLLGTGGNDGRLDFSNNFLQRLLEVVGPLPESDSRARAAVTARHHWLNDALFGSASPGLTKNSVGQFDPASGGGANAGPGAQVDSLVNPWVFVLMLEGALCFAAAATRRLESLAPGELVYPFSVRSSGAGYASAVASEEDSGRNELWLPIWARPSSLPELRALLREGRAKLGPQRRAARDGVDFARALAELGVARGISAFERYGFHVRNGLATHAVPLGSWPVHNTPSARIVDDIDNWLGRLRNATGADQAPASILRCRRSVEEGVFGLLRKPGPAAVQHLLMALGACDGQQARSRRWCADKNRLPPIPWLSSDWAVQAEEDSPVFRLAAALAGRGLRVQTRPISRGRWPSWEDTDTVQVRWGAGDLEGKLGGLLARADVRRAQGEPTPAFPRGVSLADVAWWLDHPEADRTIESLADGLALVRELPPAGHARHGWTPPLFGLLALCTDGRPVRESTQPRTPGLLRRALSGDSAGASTLALRRLRASGLPLVLHHAPRTTRPLSTAPVAPAQSCRIAAALAFPLSHAAHAQLVSELLTHQEVQP